MLCMCTYSTTKYSKKYIQYGDGDYCMYYAQSYITCICFDPVCFTRSSSFTPYICVSHRYIDVRLTLVFMRVLDLSFVNLPYIQIYTYIYPLIKPYNTASTVMFMNYYYIPAVVVRRYFTFTVNCWVFTEYFNSPSIPRQFPVKIRQFPVNSPVMYGGPYAQCSLTYYQYELMFKTL